MNVLLPCPLCWSRQDSGERAGEGTTGSVTFVTRDQQLRRKAEKKASRKKGKGATGSAKTKKHKGKRTRGKKAKTLTSVPKGRKRKVLHQKAASSTRNNEQGAEETRKPRKARKARKEAQELAAQWPAQERASSSKATASKAVPKRKARAKPKNAKPAKAEHPMEDEPTEEQTRAKGSKAKGSPDGQTKTKPCAKGKAKAKASPRPKASECKPKAKRARKNQDEHADQMEEREELYDDKLVKQLFDWCKEATEHAPQDAIRNTRYKTEVRNMLNIGDQYKLNIYWTRLTCGVHVVESGKDIHHFSFGSSWANDLYKVCMAIKCSELVVP